MSSRARPFARCPGHRLYRCSTGPAPWRGVRALVGGRAERAEQPGPGLREGRLHGAAQDRLVRDGRGHDRAGGPGRAAAPRPPRGRRAPLPPALPTVPPRTTRPGSRTTQTAATPIETRCARSSRNAAPPAACGSRRQRRRPRRRRRRPAWRRRTRARRPGPAPRGRRPGPAARPCPDARCPTGSGAPCTGIQPISPAAPPTPRRTWPSMTAARPRPVPSHTNAKSSSPAAAPPARSAIAARFTSFSITTGVCSTSRSASSTPSCQVGRFTASRGAPVRGSSTPGLPITTADRVAEADPGALAGLADRVADQAHRVVGAVAGPR